MTPKAKTYVNKLKDWRKGNEERYAKALMAPPQPSTILKAIPFPGVILIMGGRGKGKTALAHDILAQFHNRRHLGGALLRPGTLPAKQRKLLPKWIKVVTTISALPKDSACLIDEASQIAHARRSQSDQSVSLDNLISISRQRRQLIIVVVHHSRKIDLNIIHDSDRIIWKQPTEAHVIFERDEMQLYARKALDFFYELKTPRKRLTQCYCMDFHQLRFMSFRNNLPPWWSEELSAGWA